MMIEDKILLTARYAEGDLSESETAEFENRLQDDAELKQHLADYNHIHQSLKMNFAATEEEKLFKNTLKGLNKKYFVDEPKTIAFKSSFLKWLSAVAAVLVIGLLLWAPWNGNLYEQYAGNNQMLVAERGVEQETDLDKAAALYNEKKFAEALPILASLSLKDPSNTMISYYYGQTLIETNQSTKAREVLQNVYKGESAFKYDAAYAMAMSYLKVNEKANCKLWLQKIPAGTTNYQKAIDLIGKL
jgi:ABC-type multidrug transport system fused ATPase/permease subunit